MINKNNYKTSKTTRKAIHTFTNKNKTHMINTQTIQQLTTNKQQTIKRQYKPRRKKHEKMLKRTTTNKNHYTTTQNHYRNL